jgi:7-carboxy-7-deazaguanine synthase
MLQLNDLFISIDGEVSSHKQGAISTFIRFAGCNLDCAWCDAYGHEQVLFELDTRKSAHKVIDDLMNMLGKPLTNNITITGGEPLLAYENNPEAFCDLLHILHSYGYQITVETNGTYRIPNELRRFVHGFIVDCKMPMIDDKNGNITDHPFIGIYDTIGSANNIVKFLVNDAKQFDAVKKIQKTLRDTITSPTHQPTLVLSIINDHKGKPTVDVNKFLQTFGNKFFDNMILNVQIHKYLEIK